MREESLRHVVQSQVFDPESLGLIFRKAEEFKLAMKNGLNRQRLFDYLEGTFMFLLFYEPSTRTRISFAIAGERLGMKVIWTENAKDFSSMIKGETLEDTIRVLCEYHPDAIVLRHSETGAAARAAAVSFVPIINAGDGTGQHPTQALLDLFTIREAFPRIDGLTVAMVGDLLNGRTVRSLSYLLAKSKGVKFIFVSPSKLRMGRDLTDWLEEKGITYIETEDLGEALIESDVVYSTRIQKERGSDIPEKVLQKYRIGNSEMMKMRHNAILMHPLPRNDEISPEVDHDTRARYFKQAGNGMYVRMALLLWVLHKI